MEEWKESVVWLTGASSGIGAALAAELGRHGARVALTARRQSELDAVAATVVAAGGKALVIAADVGDLAAVQRAAEHIGAEWGPVDCLIANAGIGLVTPAKKLDPGAVERTMRVNFLGAVYAVSAVLPAMLESGRGTIVGVSSLAAWRGMPINSAYAASKAALSSWLEGIRIELAPKGIHVVTVHPGFVRTPMTAKNDFKMPFLVEAEDAAATIVRGIEHHQSEINFPPQLTGVMHLAKWMPNGIYDRIIGRAR